MLGSDNPVAGHFFVTWLFEMILPGSQTPKISFLLLLIHCLQNHSGKHTGKKKTQSRFPSLV